MITYIGVRSLICPRAGECDQFMAPLVNHKTANCRLRKEEEREKEMRREFQRTKKYNDRWERQTKKKKKKVRHG